MGKIVHVPKRLGMDFYPLTTKKTNTWKELFQTQVFFREPYSC